MPPLHTVLAVWLIGTNLLAVLVTCRDKVAAKRRGERVSEATLLWLATLGGGAAMFVTMLLIRHKTKKRKFMWGIPAILLAEAAAVWLLLQYV